MKFHVTKPKCLSCFVFVIASYIHDAGCSVLSEQRHQAVDHRNFPDKKHHKSFRKAHSFIQSQETLVQASGKVLLPRDEPLEAKPLGANVSKVVWFQRLLYQAHHRNNATTKTEHTEQVGGYLSSARVLAQILFGVLYYFLIVSKYPKINGLQPTPEAIKLQSENELSATMHVRFPNLCFAFCCSGPRAAHTFDSTNVMNYWPGCIAMTLLPCCTLWVVNSCTDLNEKLGGVKKDIFTGLLCACCCSCCVIAQDAEALDLITGVRTEFCGVTEDKIDGDRSRTDSMGWSMDSFKMIYCRERRSDTAVTSLSSVKEA